MCESVVFPLSQGHSKMDVLRVVSTLRQDRSGCVQTREQYRFIHQVSPWLTGSALSLLVYIIYYVLSLLGTV